MKLILDCCNNHLGDDQILDQMILQSAGYADFLKFQLYDTEKLNPQYPNFREKHYNLKKCEITKDKLEHIFAACNEYDISPMFTIFSLNRLRDLEYFDEEYYALKIASPNAMDIEFIAKVKEHMSKTLFCKLLVISHGMSTEDEIKKTKDAFPKDKHLYCVSRYPTLITEIEDKYLEENDGFSDHTIGMNAATAICKIHPDLEFYEKHYTLSRNLPGSDHEISVEANELFRFKMVLDEKQTWDNYKRRFLND
jgi:sialic acid synthase SpsE